MKGIRAQNTIIISYKGHCRAMEKYSFSLPIWGFAHCPSGAPIPCQLREQEIKSVPLA